VLLIARGADFRRRHPESGATLLHAAAAKGHVEVVRVLLAAGADPEARDNYGATPLDEALRYRHGPVVEFLLRQGARLQGSSALLRRLQEAVLRGQPDVVRMLLEAGADPAMSTPQGSTLLHDAALKGHTEIVSLLLDRGAPVNLANSTGATPLHDAALAGQAAVARLLLARGADVNARERQRGATPLHLAASWGRCQVLAVLLENGADLNSRDHRGQTPLAAALENNQEEAAALLRARGAR